MKTLYYSAQISNEESFILLAYSSFWIGFHLNSVYIGKVGCGASSNVPVSGTHAGKAEGFTLFFFHSSFWIGFHFKFN